MRLWMRLALVMGALVLAPVFSVGLVAMEVATRRAEQSSEERLRREAADHAELVARWVHDQARFLLGQPEPYKNRLGSLPLELQSGFARQVYLQLFSAVTVVLVDGDGRAVVDPVFRVAGGDRPPSSARRAQALIDRLPLAAARDQPAVVHLGQAWLPDGLAGAPSLPMVVSAFASPDSAQQRFLGVEVSLEVAEDLQSGVTADHVVALMDGAGAPLVGGAHPLLPAEGLRSLLGTGQQADFSFEAEGGEVRGTIVPVPNTPEWSLVVAEPAAAVHRPAAAIRSRMAPYLLLSVAGALVLALIVAGTVSRPVSQLRDAALRVADGELDTRAEVDRSDELGELGRAFDYMAARLQANQTEIEAQQSEIQLFNRVLQDRVAERTRELEQAQSHLVRSGQLAAVAELGAGLAHELNNPLTGVLGIAQLLLGRSPDDPLLADLEEQAVRCREVVGTLLRVSHLEVDPKRAPVVDLKVVLVRVTGLVAGAFRQRGVGLELAEGGSEELRVRVDPAHGTRLLTQLLAGIRAGLNSGATVTVAAAPDGVDVAVTVTSSAPVAEHADRADDWLAASHGLWVARQLIAAVGGRLEEADDRTRFRMVLPGVAP